jgi:hypothetical protein
MWNIFTDGRCLGQRLIHWPHALSALAVCHWNSLSQPHNSSVMPSLSPAHKLNQVSQILAVLENCAFQKMAYSSIPVSNPGLHWVSVHDSLLIQLYLSIMIMMKLIQQLCLTGSISAHASTSQQAVCVNIWLMYARQQTIHFIVWSNLILKPTLISHLSKLDDIPKKQMINTW